MLAYSNSESVMIPKIITPNVMPLFFFCFFFIEFVSVAVFNNLKMRFCVNSQRNKTFFRSVQCLRRTRRKTLFDCLVHLWERFRVESWRMMVLRSQLQAQFF